MFLSWPSMLVETLRGARQGASRAKAARYARASARRAALMAKTTSPLRIELGCGLVRRDGWIGLDVSHTADFYCDLTTGIPFPDETVDEIHSEHFLEHLNRSQLDALLRECLRVLKIGGRISFSVPNVRPYLEAYVNGRTEWLRQKVFDRPTDSDWESPLDVVSWLALCGNQHLTLFDEEIAVKRMSEAGFDSIRLREFDSSVDVVLRESSLYVEARKP